MLQIPERDTCGEHTRGEDERSRLVDELRTSGSCEREFRYRALFDESPVALWEKDYSAALAFVRETASAQQIREGLTAQLVEAAAAKVRIVDANRKALQLFGADGLPELAARWSETLGPESWRTIGDELLALLDGRAHFETESVRRTLSGQPLHVRVQVTGLPAARVIVSMVDITASKQAEQALREAVARQEVLLREIHHRVKNNLAVIASLFYLSSTHTADAGVVALLEDSRRRIRSMALVHETLYGSDNLARVDMAQYTRILANEVMAAYRPLSANVQLTCDLQPVSLSVDLAVPCGLILNELVSNAFKHAFPEGRAGVVHVSLQERTRPGDRADGGTDCIMCVFDDGVGLPPDLDVVTHHSLGLRLVRLLATQLRGVVTLERKSAGTKARVSFTRCDDDPRSDDC
jgi:two-component sensor histidine kinase/PAS domain-containing protein